MTTGRGTSGDLHVEYMIILPPTDDPGHVRVTARRCCSVRCPPADGHCTSPFLSSLSSLSKPYAHRSGLHVVIYNVSLHINSYNDTSFDLSSSFSYTTSLYINSYNDSSFHLSSSFSYTTSLHINNYNDTWTQRLIPRPHSVIQRLST